MIKSAAMVRKIIRRDEAQERDVAAGRVENHPQVPVAVAMPDMGGIVHRKVVEAQAQATELLAAAQTEAEQLQANARALLAQVDVERSAAREAGYREGRDEGLASCTEFATRLLRQKEQFFAEIEHNLLRLVQTTAEKVIGQLTAESQAVLLTVVRQAIEAAIGDRVLVRLHPDDYARVLAADNELRASIDRMKRLQFRADESIAVGGCVVETEVGTVDAQLPIQLAALRKALGVKDDV